MTSQLSEPDNSLVERVRKLLDKAARTDNEHEAEVFSRKAAQMVARHRIDPARLVNEPANDDLAVIELPIGRGAYVRGRLALLTGIADSHDVRVVFQSTPSGSVAFLAGHRSELELVQVMYTSLHQQASVHMSAIRKSTGAATQRHRRAFLFGFADRIRLLLAESRASVEANERHAGAGGDAMALAIVERRKRVDDFADSTWGRVRSASSPKPVSPDGFAHGVSAAERADVGRTRLAKRRAIGRGS